MFFNKINNRQKNLALIVDGDSEFLDTNLCSSLLTIESLAVPSSAGNSDSMSPYKSISTPASAILFSWYNFLVYFHGDARGVWLGFAWLLGQFGVLSVLLALIVGLGRLGYPRQVKTKENLFFSKCYVYFSIRLQKVPKYHIL